MRLITISKAVRMLVLGGCLFFGIGGPQVIACTVVIGAGCICHCECDAHCNCVCGCGCP